MLSINKNYKQNSSAENFLFIFVAEFGSKFMSHEHDEKGIRCKTGAVPAAVNPNRKKRFVLLNYQPLFRRKTDWEGINNRDKPEDLP